MILLSPEMKYDLSMTSEWKDCCLKTNVFTDRYAAEHQAFLEFFDVSFIFVIRGAIKMLTFLFMWLVNLGINWQI